MKFNHAPAYGFGRAKKLEIERTDPLFTPGPGQYAPAKQGIREPTWKIGTGQRGTQLKNDNPGPGQYTLSGSFPNGPKYSMASKAGAIDPAKFNVAPGPGQYQPQYKSGVPKYTMRSRPNTAKVDYTPGPGNYNIRKDENMKVPSYKFGTEKKDGLNLAQAKGVPGPGNYEYNADGINPKAPKFSFGKELRGTKARPKTPGPGAYNAKQYVGKEGPKITMSSKLGFDPQAGDTRFVPGPGQYTTSGANILHSKAPAYRIGTAQRRGLYNTDNNPGPGQYGPDNCTNYVRPKTPSWVIGTGKRGNLNQTDKNNPGPGNYNISKGIGANAPKYSITGKGNYGYINNGNPGPGQYNSDNFKTKTHNPAWKIGTGTREDNLKRVVREGFPGPGMYYVDKNGLKGPHYKFGTEKRGFVQKSDTPGPGQYHIPCAIVDVNDYTREQGNFDPNYRYI